MVQLFDAGTDDLVWEGTTDSSGRYEIGSLATGAYDVRVDGVRIQTFHHVKADHTHDPDQTFRFFIGDTISADANQKKETPLYAPGVAGSIVRISLVAHATSASADTSVHLLVGSQNGASALTFASDSVWQHQVNPGEILYRYTHVDDNPGVTLTADQVITMGIDNVVSGVQGLTLNLTFRPD